MSKLTIVEGNNNDKDNIRVLMVKGEKGDKGDANTLSIGTVEETETASATITGDAPNQTLNLGIPKADPNTLSIGTVTKGVDASATITGDAPNQTLNLVLPKGDTGEQGPAGYEVPAGSVIGWDSSSSIPEGYEEIDNPDNFSTSETKIGTWIDGKPIYRIVLTGTKVSGTNLLIDLPQNIDKVVTYYGTLNIPNGFKFPLDHYESSTVYHRSSIKGTGQFELAGGTGTYSNGAVILIVEYTKTTD
jgi:hypothetical protein